MKVGTDGSLLGAWTSVEKTKRILDVGTGTGLVALMLAQRAPSTAVDAIDVDHDAFYQASHNVESSPFVGRIRVHLASLAAYQQTCTCRPYDLIVSNPPYFTKSLKSPESARNFARHDESLPLTSLLSDAGSLLTTGGRLAIILPLTRFESLKLQFAKQGFRLIRLTRVCPRPDKPPKRILFELSNADEKTTVPVIETLVLEDIPGNRSTAYRTLMRDFYL
jgi:tRNA1Val (adenine37-N6)-methyltransferase